LTPWQITTTPRGLPAGCQERKKILTPPALSIRSSFIVFSPCAFQPSLAKNRR